MKTVRVLTILVAALLALGEIARWWGDPRLVPLAFDEIAVAAAMLGATLVQRRFGPAPLAAAWGAFCGLVLSLLVPTLDHLLHGPPKDSAAFYAVILTAMLALGLGVVWWILAQSWERRPVH
ncbi:hypothetical protein [Sphingobium sp. D43FB]|uniref:hypothetical protein n=1 Tax=Sphingobium sp. D43FB TaxID=2017595 RepID=UPI000BB599B8|nr:hypothetical protein [Sphingobium sp. D43FB]PBN42281.1 hypothetical protein SxD43FB_17320 [Sphingobium sp. D43FB]